MAIGDEMNWEATKHTVAELTGRVDKMEAVLIILDKKIAINEILFERMEQSFNKNNDVLNRTVEVMNSIEKTMMVMQESIRNNAEKTQKIEKKVDELTDKFEVSEEKAKTDFRVIFKDFISNKIMWIISGGLIVAIIELVLNFLKIK